MVSWETLLERYEIKKYIDQQVYLILCLWFNYQQGIGCNYDLRLLRDYVHPRFNILVKTTRVNH